MKIAFVLNPTSGTHRNPQKIAELIQTTYDASSYTYEICYTEYAGHATEIAKEKSEAGFDVVVAIGGDGTVNEVAAGLLHTKSSLAIVPAGSGNGFARHFKVPLDQKKAIESIPNSVIKRIDTGTINGHHFNGVCGMGYDAYVSQKFSEQKTRGLKTYIKVMFVEFFRFKPETYTIRFDDYEVKQTCYTLTIANAPEYGNGAVISPNSIVDDGMFEICAMKPLNFFNAWIIAWHMLRGTLNRSRFMTYYKANQISIEREKDPVIHIDGTPLKTELRVTIELLRNSLNVLVPKS
jgi:diacylglycerol kinase (ATP)